LPANGPYDLIIYRRVTIPNGTWYKQPTLKVNDRITGDSGER